MTKILSRAVGLLAALLLFAGGPPAFAQTALTSTTIAASITDTSSKAVSLTSATGISASSASQQYFLLVDRELMQVQALNSTIATVIRGVAGTRATAHLSGATAYFAVPSAFFAYVPGGYCVRTNLTYVPVIVAGDQDETNNGTALDCLGSQWVQTSKPGPVVFGSTVASATTIAATGTYFKVSGTTAIATITVPAGWAPGMCLAIEPTGLGSTTTAGNIGLATTSVVGKMLFECWNGTKWQPSY